jgi:vancomycin resistance protein YoaR
LRRSHRSGAGRKIAAPRRASFLPDPGMSGQQSGWTIIADTQEDNWQAASQVMETPQPENQQYIEYPGAYANVSPADPEDPWDASFVVSGGTWYEEPEPQPAAAVYAGRRRFPLVSLLVTMLSVFIISVCLAKVLNAASGSSAFDDRLSQMQGQVFFPGISIDGIDVSGKTPGQIREQSSGNGFGAVPEVDIRLVIDQTAYAIDNSHLTFERNLEDVMEAAWSIGRQGSYSAMSSGMTPFEYRWRHVSYTLQRGSAFITKVSYNKDIVSALAQGIAQQVNREPINAVVSWFNFVTKEFDITQDVPGRRIDDGLVAAALEQALDNREYRTLIQLNATPVLPRVSSVDLKNSFTCLSSFTTKTTSNQDRNNNIALAAQAINNTTLMPGETFSFNEAIGQRTPEKGYRGAPAIQGGVLIDDVGGGVCQVSSTLFCAAASAGMAIVERTAHAWPVSYMDKGLDATVNWPNLDFKFKNNQDTPVFIIARYENRKLTIEFHGMLPAPGEGIFLETRLISSQPPPSEPLMQHNPSLPYGSRKELKEARTGYVVDTYRVYTRNGSEYRREKLFTSKYRMVQQVIEFN